MVWITQPYFRFLLNKCSWRLYVPRYNDPINTIIRSDCNATYTYYKKLGTYLGLGIFKYKKKKKLARKKLLRNLFKRFFISFLLKRFQLGLIPGFNNLAGISSVVSLHNNLHITLLGSSLYVFSLIYHFPL